MRRKALVIVAILGCVTLLTIALSELSGHQMGTFSVKRLKDNVKRRSTQVVLSSKQVLFTAEVAARFERRRQRMKEACRRLKLTSYRGMRHASERFIFPTRSSPVVLYCPVPKTGTTFLKKTFATANNASQVIWVDRFHVRPVDNYDKAVMFFFTREPYSRILSAYIDKLWSPNLQFWRVLGKPLVHGVRHNASLRSLECGHDVTFPEFIRYFIDGMTRGSRINTHVVPTHKFCETCDYDYDYIGKLETFREDAAYILSAINVTTSESYSNNDDVISHHIIQAFYTNHIDKTHCAKKHHILLRAWRALQIRGIISMSIPFPFSESQALSVFRTTFTLVIQKAVDKTNLIFRNLDQKQIHSVSLSKSRASRSSQSPPLLQSRDRQKKMALASAYSLVPKAHKLKMMKLMREEFELFGYEAKPDDVFASKKDRNQKIFDLSDI
ncbi:hypothetical protein V1264_023176 [Littorina saxatilis]|uniref:Carbohydrate sulfotransferase n=2 Tax=Littorina saxatilis TaxID=31220 RepID=A0AAN9G9F0_9CAEN